MKADINEMLESEMNRLREAVVLSAGERIAQMVIMPVKPAEFVVADELSDTSRGEGGFGSTGKC